MIRWNSKFPFVYVVLFISFFVYLNWDDYKAKKLYEAASKENISEMEELLKEEVDINQSLILALDVVDKVAVKTLVKYGANIKEIGNEYLVKSLVKVKNNHFRGDYIDLTQLMIQYKVDLSKASGYYGRTPLMGAIYAKQDRVINTLLSIPVDVNVVDKNCETALFYLEKVETAKLLLSKGANIHHENCHSATPLVNSCKKENIELVEFFISKGAKIDAYHNREQMDCLLYGIEHKNKALIDLVLKNGANINYSEANQKSPLTFAISMESIDMVEYLISKRVKVNLHDKNGNLPLILSVAKEDISLVEYLLKQGADIDLKDGFGNTALELAKISKNEKLILTLKKATIK